MNEFIHTIKIGNTNKSLSLELYQDQFSLVSTWEGRDGSIKPNWVFRQERKDGENVPGKAIPSKLTLGDKATSISICLQLLAALGWKQETVGDDLPF
jgi:hypothetical protein